MAYYGTCRHCALERAPCARRESVAASIKGLGLTSVKFRCSLKTPLFRDGQRVAVTWPVKPDDWAWDEGFSLETWPATVVSKSMKGFVILVDDVPSDYETPAREYIQSTNLFCNVRPSRLKAIDEPDRVMCLHCRNPQSVEGSVPGCFVDNEPGMADFYPRCLAQGMPTGRASLRGEIGGDLII